MKIPNLRNYDIILIGELHNWNKSIKLEEKIIRQSQVKFFLHEMLENYKVNPSKARKWLKLKMWKSKIFKYKYIKNILRMIASLNVSGHGCDLKNHGIKNINHYYITDRELTKTEGEAEERLIQRREEKQGKTIARATKLISPVLAMVGAYHLRNKSVLFKELAKLKKGSILILYPVYKKEVFYGQKNIKFSDLNYMSKVLKIRNLTAKKL